ncbi:MAG TPA: nuclear transport factor 2 family protein [Methylovirgula sp.]|nr:nuclear transport factor 2 family protein [Methylovirgula sp.]
MSNDLNRRALLAAGAVSAIGASLLSEARVEALTGNPNPACEDLRNREAQQKEVELFFRSYYAAKDDLDIAAFAAHWASTGLLVQDHMLGVNCGPPGDNQTVIAGTFGPLFQAVGTPGRFSKFVHATGDLRYGVMSEFVDVPGTFFARGFDLMTANEMQGGLIQRYTDHWDSMQLAQVDLTGAGDPTTTVDLLSPTGPFVSVPVAAQLAPMHPNGPRFAAPCAPTKPTKNPASDGLMEFVSKFHGALARGDYNAVLNMMTEDCIFIHPLVFRNSPGYRTFNADTTLKGKDAIAAFLRAVLALLPDGENSYVTRVLGSLIGGGYQSQSGGIYAKEGLTREGIFMATALDFALDGRVCRMSVKFDTYQMTSAQRLAIKQAWASAC